MKTLNLVVASTKGVRIVTRVYRLRKGRVPRKRKTV